MIFEYLKNMVIETIVIIVVSSVSGLIVGGTTVGILYERIKRRREFEFKKLSDNSIMDIIMYEKPFETKRRKLTNSKSPELIL